MTILVTTASSLQLRTYLHLESRMRQRRQTRQSGSFKPYGSRSFQALPYNHSSAFGIAETYVRASPLPEGAKDGCGACRDDPVRSRDRKSTRLNSSHEWISYAVFCLKKK